MLTGGEPPASGADWAMATADSAAVNVTAMAGKHRRDEIVSSFICSIIREVRSWLMKLRAHDRLATVLGYARPGVGVGFRIG